MRYYPRHRSRGKKMKKAPDWWKIDRRASWAAETAKRNLPIQKSIHYLEIRQTGNPNAKSPPEILNRKEYSHVAKRKRYDWRHHRSRRLSSWKSKGCSIRRSLLAPTLRCCGYRHLASEEKSPLKPLTFERIGNGLGRQLPQGSVEQGSGRRIA